MEYITPTLTKLYTMADTFTSRASHPRLIVASLSMLECCSFFFPELRSDVWRRTWDCMMLGCREKAVQTGITQAAIASPSVRPSIRRTEVSTSFARSSSPRIERMPPARLTSCTW